MVVEPDMFSQFYIETVYMLRFPDEATICVQWLVLLYSQTWRYGNHRRFP